MNLLSRFFCWVGCHRWDSPGGHCEDCGACDLFFDGHAKCITGVFANHEHDGERWIPTFRFNSIETRWDGGKFFTYEDAIRLAGYAPGRIITVVFDFPRPNQACGSLTPGKAIGFVPGIRITAIDTSNA